MTREERAARIEELRRWIAEQNEEFRDEGFPSDVQSAWDQNNVELREHERVTAELEARDTRIAELVQVDAGRSAVMTRVAFAVPLVLSSFPE
jgi:hypothetical protein